MVTNIFENVSKERLSTSTKLSKEINEIFTGLLQTLSSFRKEQINAIPFEGSWTAGQVAGHVIKAGFGIVDLLNSEVEDTGRNPDDKVEGIRNSFQDMSVKMKSPEFVLPDNITYEKADLLSDLERIKAA